jgi:hypothetical protein
LRSTVLAVALSVSSVAAADAAADEVCRGHLATVEPDGSVSAGSKDALRAAVRAGLPLRVGWHVGGSSDEGRGVSHWADAGFVSDFRGEVFAQIADIQKQVPQRDVARIALVAGRWSGLLGTNGMLEGIFDDAREPNEPAKVRTIWCVAGRDACAPTWRLVYRHDADGAPQAGSKDALFDAVRRGRPIRFAWGMKADTRGRTVSVEHSAEPVFLTIMNGTELFVQLPEHIGQKSYFESDKARFDEPHVMWRGLMGTTGAFDAVLVDRATGEEEKRLPQRAAIAWFALAPDPVCDGAAPAPLAVPGGVRRR